MCWLKRPKLLEVQRTWLWTCKKRANDLAAQSSNKLSFLSDVESEFEDNEHKLNELSAQLVGLNCNMLIHLQVIEAKANYHRTCTRTRLYMPARGYGTSLYTYKC